jgi:hypothetical protein
VQGTQPGQPGQPDRTVLADDPEPTCDRSYRAATADALAESVAAFLHGLISRGVDPAIAQDLTQDYLFGSMPGTHHHHED